MLPSRGPNVRAATVQLDQPSGPHSHDFLEIVVVVGGKGVHQSAIGQRAVARGSVILVLPGSWHGYEDCRDLRVWNLYVAPEVRNRELSGLRGDPLLGKTLWASSLPPLADPAGTTEAPRIASVVSEDSLGGLERALQRLAGEQAEYAGASVARIGLLLQVLGVVCGSLTAELAAVSYSGKKAHPALLSATRLLEERSIEHWSLSRLADEVHLSPAYLARLFKQQLGISPISYLTRVRAERAATLLIEGDASIAEVGRSVGWPDPSYASRRFSSVFGRSPRAYRYAFRAHQESAAASPDSAADS